MGTSQKAVVMCKVVITKKTKASAEALKKHLEKEHPSTKGKIIIKK